MNQLVLDWNIFWHKHHEFNADTVSNITSCRCRSFLLLNFYTRRIWSQKWVVFMVIV